MVKMIFLEAYIFSRRWKITLNNKNNQEHAHYNSIARIDKILQLIS